MSSVAVTSPPTPAFSRDRQTWVAYVVLAWFAYLQAAPGLVIPHLRDELGLSYTVGGLHVAAFALGAMTAGFVGARFERALGRVRLLWCGVALLAVGTVLLTLARLAVLTIGSTLVMGLGGGIAMVVVQALLVDHHGPRSATALTEANVGASVSYIVLIGALALAAALGAGWRVALLASLAVPLVVWSRNRSLAVTTAPVADGAGGRLPGAFWIAIGMLVCAVAAEWCVSSWAATFVQVAVGVPADTAVTLMIGYFAGVLGGRLVGSRLTRRYDPAHLLGVALGVTAVGFAVLWPAGSAAQALLGLALLGVGLGNLFPMAISVTMALAPGQTALANGRAVSMTSLAVLLAPLTVGALADATSLGAALGVVPVVVVLAAVGLAFVQRSRRRSR